MSFAFLLTSLIVVASPGTGVLYTLATALTGGARAAVAASVGCTLGIVPAMLAAMVGLAAVLHTSALAFAALKWLGVGYLLYMAWQSLREQGALSVEPRKDGAAEARVIVKGFLINILNPKLSIFFLAFLPQFIAGDERPSAGAYAGALRNIHADDLRRVRAVWPVCGQGSRPCREPAQGNGVASPRLCGRLCAARCEAGVRGKVTREACHSGEYPIAVIPGRPAGLSPESISPGVPGGKMDSGFSLREPRNDGRIEATYSPR